jgi:deoxyribodipyrimidine photolyase-related protein
MFLGSYLLLLGIDPKQVYKIFMEWTIDAYDWVMVPNIFGMSQYASPIMMTRPYFSSYNYLLKMSNYKRDEWCKIWEGLYYSFINRHRKILSKNYAFASQVKNLDNKTTNDKKKLFAIAKDYQDKL